MNPSSFPVTANRHVTIGSGASLLPPPTAAFSPPPPGPPIRLLVEMKLRLEQHQRELEQRQREWAEHLDRIHPPSVAPFAAETPSPPLLTITQPQLSPPPPSPSPDLPVTVRPPSSAKPDLFPPPLAAVLPLPSSPDVLESSRPVETPPPLSAVPDLSPPSRICSLVHPSPPPIQICPPFVAEMLMTPLPSPPASQRSLLAVRPPLTSPAPSKGEAAQQQQHQTLLLGAWAQSVTRAQEMNLEVEAHQLEPEPGFLLVQPNPLLKSWVQQELKPKPKFDKMQVLLKERIGIG